MAMDRYDENGKELPWWREHADKLMLLSAWIVFLIYRIVVELWGSGG